MKGEEQEQVMKGQGMEGEEQEQMVKGEEQDLMVKDVWRHV